MPSTVKTEAAWIDGLEAEIQTLRAEIASSRLILDAAVDYAIITLDTSGCITRWNAGAQRIVGYSEAEVLGRSGKLVFTSEDRAGARFATELHLAQERGSAVNERWHVRRDGSRFWASGMMMPLLGSDGRLHGFLNILRDRTEARAEMERRELLTAEMNHRIKNTLATVQAVATQTGRHAATKAEFLVAFEARLLALAASHDVLIRAGWEEAPLREVVEGALAAYGGEPCCVSIEGLPVLLAANLVMMVSLALHELATNAAKHGALSVPEGRVGVAWTVASTCRGQRRVEVVWQEHDGPVVYPPQHRGFGSQLLERSMASIATIQRDFHPQGLVCCITLPLGTGS